MVGPKLIIDFYFVLTTAPIRVYAAWPDHTEVLRNSVIRFEISSSDHGMRSHVPAFLVWEGEKYF